MNKLTYFTALKNIRDSMPEDKRASFDFQYAIQEKSIAVSLVLSLLFGTLGIDRFYLGHIFLGILKLITLGGLGLWTLIDWFLIMGAARAKNIQIAAHLSGILSCPESIYKP